MEQNMIYESKYPADIEFEGKIVLYIENGLREFKSLFKDEFDLNNYVVTLNKFEKNGNYCVTFIPKVASMFEGIEFEIPNQGMYANGRGVEFFFSIKNDELLKTVYMR